jgi:hypothetical protein
MLLFDKILAKVADWPKVMVGYTPYCIVFTRCVGFLVIRPMKKWLDIKFYSAIPHPEKPVLKSVAACKKFANHIRVTTLDDLRPGLFKYIRMSYELT